MINQENTFGSVEYLKTVPNPNENFVEIQATLSIPNLKELLNNESITEIISPNVTETTPDDWKFQFKLMKCKAVNKIKFFYLSPTQLFCKSVKLELLLSNNGNYSFSKEICKQECLIVEANTWYYIRELLFADVERYAEINNINSTVRSLVFRFEFVVKKEFQVPGTQLSNDMLNIFLTGIHTDVVMKCVDDEEIRAHKIMLVSRSPVLKAHFEHNTTETITNIIESPFESAVLHEVLLFIYTDKAPKVDEMPEKLLEAAEFYQLNRLKGICEDALHRQLTIDNAVEILQLADLYSANELKHLVLQFIQQDKEKLITKTEGWIKLQSVDLLKKIYEYSK